MPVRRERGGVTAHTQLTQLDQYLLQKAGLMPSPEQEKILACDKRFQLVSGGEQAGKSTVAAAKLYLSYAHDMVKAEEAGYPPPLIYWLVAADYDRTSREFMFCQQYFESLNLVYRTSKIVNPGFIEIGGGPKSRPITAIIKTKSAKDPRRLAMESPSGVIGCEASQLDLETYWRIMARAGPRRAWVFLAGTFENSLGWYPGLYKAWLPGTADEQSFKMPSWSNRGLYPGGRQDPEIMRLERELPEQVFQERICGEPCPPQGLVFKEFRTDAHIKDITWNPDHPVYLWIDPGYNHAYAVEAAQIINGQVRVFDEIYERGMITTDVIQIAVRKPWWQGQKFGVVDVAAKQHQAMPAVHDIWSARPDEGGAGLFLESQPVDIKDGIDRFASLLKIDPITNDPGMVIAPHCRGLLSELGAYPSPFDNQVHVYHWKTDNNGNVIGENPEDRYNDGIKAVTYGLVNYFGFVKAGGRVSNKVIMKRY